jgi:hypothetical protein
MLLIRRLLESLSNTKFALLSVFLIGHPGATSGHVPGVILKELSGFRPPG